MKKKEYIQPLTSIIRIESLGILKLSGYTIDNGEVIPIEDDDSGDDEFIEID